MRRIYGVSLVVVAAACANQADSLACEKAIGSELGVGSMVTVNTFSNSHGKRTVVIVQLTSIPHGEPDATRASVSAIVKRTFREHVDQIDVRF
jgi:hypothetical protein